MQCSTASKLERARLKSQKLVFSFFVLISAKEDDLAERLTQVQSLVGYSGPAWHNLEWVFWIIGAELRFYIVQLQHGTLK